MPRSTLENLMIMQCQPTPMCNKCTQACSWARMMPHGMSHKLIDAGQGASAAGGVAKFSFQSSSLTYSSCNNNIWNATIAALLSAFPVRRPQLEHGSRDWIQSVHAPVAEYIPIPIRDCMVSDLAATEYRSNSPQLQFRAQLLPGPHFSCATSCHAGQAPSSASQQWRTACQLDLSDQA